jgi:putative DNA primase/helicase
MEPGAVHIYGHSSSGKSTLLRAAWSVWGGPEGLRTWRATANALEGIASIHADTLLALDEIGQADLRALDEAAYLLLNGRGKMRANVDGSTRATRAWSLMVLSTGEPTLADRLTEDGKKPRAGQEVRLVDIPADAGQGLGAWENIHDQSTPAQFSDEIKAACAKYHGTLGRAWAQYLAGHQGEAQQLRSVIRRTAEHWATGTESGQVVRVAERFALIGLAGELAAQAGLVPWTEGQSLSAANSCLLSWLAARGGGGDTEDIQAVSTVQGFIARYGASRFQTIGAGADDIPPSNPHERIVERAGFRRTTLSGEEQFIFTKEQWSELFRGRNPLQAARAMDRAGLLIRNDGSLAQKVALPDLGRVRAYVVSIAQQNEEPAP